MAIGLVILQGITIAVIVFGALAVFLIRRWFVGSSDATPPWLWLRFTVLLFGVCLIALIEGVLLQPYGLFWFVPAVGITLVVAARLRRSCCAGGFKIGEAEWGIGTAEIGRMK